MSMGFAGTAGCFIFAHRIEQPLRLLQRVKDSTGDFSKRVPHRSQCLKITLAIDKCDHITNMSCYAAGVELTGAGVVAARKSACATGVADNTTLVASSACHVTTMLPLNPAGVVGLASPVTDNVTVAPLLLAAVGTRNT